MKQHNLLYKNLIILINPNFYFFFKGNTDYDQWIQDPKTLGKFMIMIINIGVNR